MIKLFDEKPISELFGLNDQSIVRELNKYTDIYLIDSDKFSETTSQKFRINVPIIKLSETKVLTSLEDISTSSVDPFHFAHPKRNNQVAVITYSIPYAGDAELFRIRPSQFSYRNLNA